MDDASNDNVPDAVRVNANTIRCVSDNAVRKILVLLLRLGIIVLLFRFIRVVVCLPCTDTYKPYIHI